MIALFLSGTALAEPSLNGISVHTHLGQDHFIGAIFATSLSTDAGELLSGEGEKAMELRVITSHIYARRFRRLWIESIAINSGSSELTKHAQNMADFSNLLKVNLRQGDSVRIEKTPVVGVKILINRLELGRIADATFFDLLLRSWVGPVPLSSSFKNQLLAGGKVNQQTRKRFYNIAPTPKRVIEINQALAELTAAKAAATPAKQPTQATNTNTETTPKPVAEAPSDTGEPASENGENATPAETSAATAAEIAPESTQSATAELEPTNQDIAQDQDQGEPNSVLDSNESSISAESLLSHQIYIGKLTRQTSRFVKYPRRALEKQRQGTVTLAVTVNRNGEVIKAEYTEESKYKELNRAAMKAVKRASPFPEIPKSMNTDTLVLNIPVTFKLN